jgi:hypothetical protein
VIRSARAAASQSAAAAAAQAVLDGGGGAVDALIAGFFGAAGAHPGVLFAPVVAVVAGFGAGGRVFDGRCAQPGRGAARPRGFVEGTAIPAGARVAVPRSIGMLMLLGGQRGRATLGELSRPGVAVAESSGAKLRGALLRKVGAAGVLALRNPDVARALLAVGGALAGGALTEADLEEAAPAEGDAETTVVSEGLTVHAPPFSTDDGEDPDVHADAETIVACDGRGVIAALSYVPARHGVAVPELEVTLGRTAVPVRRGVTRVAPGTVLRASAPIAIALQSGGFAAAVGLPGLRSVDAVSTAELARGASLETALAALHDRVGGRAAVAVVTDGKSARTTVL